MFYANCKFAELRILKLLTLWPYFPGEGETVCSGEEIPQPDWGKRLPQIPHCNERGERTSVPQCDCMGNKHTLSAYSLKTKGVLMTHSCFLTTFTTVTCSNLLLCKTCWTCMVCLD